jgi:thioredoxin 1
MSPQSIQLTIYCLCVAWCRTCDAYVEVFESLKQACPRNVSWVWVDIEDHADLLDDVDVENFPSLLVTSGEYVYFFGPVLPQKAIAAQLIESVMAGKIDPQAVETLQALNQRFLNSALHGKAPQPI